MKRISKADGGRNFWPPREATADTFTQGKDSDKGLSDPGRGLASRSQPKPIPVPEARPFLLRTLGAGCLEHSGLPGDMISGSPATGDKAGSGRRQVSRPLFIYALGSPA